MVVATNKHVHTNNKQLYHTGLKYPYKQRYIWATITTFMTEMKTQCQL